MGQSAMARAKELFKEDVVMNQYEELFAELEQLRSAAPSGARKSRPVPASIDPVQAFGVYPSHQFQASDDRDPGPYPSTVCLVAYVRLEDRYGDFSMIPHPMISRAICIRIC